MPTIRAAALQLPAHDYEHFHEAWPSVLPLVRTAAQHARLVVLPEGTAPAYVLTAAGDDGRATAQALEDLAKIAAQTNTTFVIGAARSHEGHVYNSAFVVDNDGSVAGYADKFCLWHFDARWYKRGERIAPIATSLGLLGVFICADGRIPAIARSLRAQGATALVMPTAWVTSNRSCDDLENLQADLLAQTRALENSIPLIAANKCGVERGVVKYCGKSQIVDASGARLAIASQTSPETLYADITLENVQPFPFVSSPSIRPQSNPDARTFRLGIHVGDPIPVHETCAMLDIDALLSASNVPAEFSEHRSIRSIDIDDARACDPIGCVADRLAGVHLFVWHVRTIDEQVALRIARTRAAELRCYVALFSTQGRAWIIDPGGALLCAADSGCRVAVASVTPANSCTGIVAPHTDVLAELARAMAVAG